MDLKELVKVLDYIAEEKKINKEQVVDVVEASLAAAYRKEYGHKGMVVRSHLDLDSGDISFYQVKTVIDPSEVRIVEETEEEAAPVSTEEEEGMLPRYNPDKHIFLEEAKVIKPEVNLGEEL